MSNIIKILNILESGGCGIDPKADPLKTRYVKGIKLSKFQQTKVLDDFNKTNLPDEEKEEWLKTTSFPVTFSGHLFL